MSIRLIAGDCRDALPTLAADSVQCVVTSPPYYGLRDYGTALWDGGDAACSHSVARVTERSRLQHDEYAPPSGWTNRDATPPRQCACGAVRIDRQIGLEATPDLYLATMVAVFREVRRVLRPDGTCWVNMGDSYNANQGAGWTPTRGHNGHASPKVNSGLAAKQLLLMPARLALALQADGWWVRSAITWCKPSPMPESCTDRPTSATEMVYLLTKRANYFYDSIAIREDAVFDHPSGNGYKRDPRLSYGGRGNDEQWNSIGGTRNARNWWVINSKPFPDAHFATFPPELAERCIRAGTSERGACSACGKSWGRVTEKLFAASGPERGKINDFERDNGWEGVPRGTTSAVTTGWQPGCKCDADVMPCTVLDPFAGAGTTLLVADRQQRDAIGIELNTAYTEMAMERCRADAPLFADLAPVPVHPVETEMADLFAEAAE